MKQPRKIFLLLLASTIWVSGCEYVLSDVATRIRYSLLDAKAELQGSQKETLTLALRPNHAPDGCKSGAKYRVVLSPYKGNKQVAVGDIDVYCDGVLRYYTGFGSEEIRVAREMAVEKNAEDEVRITLRKTSSGIEIVGLE